MARDTPGTPRVCIVTPGPIGSNPRVVKEADALHEAGFEVTVISTQALAHVEMRDQSLIRRIGWRARRIDLRSKVRWRLMRGRQLAARLAFRATGMTRFARAGVGAATGALARAARAVRADLYIAHYPAALPAAAAAARKYGAAYAYDAEDFHLGDWPEGPAHAADRALVRAVEGATLPGCAYVTAAAPAIAEAYEATYGIARPTVVLNVFPLGEASEPPQLATKAVAGPSLYWFSQTVGPNRGLECAARAVGLAATKPHLYLRGTAVPGFMAHLEAIAAEAGGAGQIHLLETAAPDDMERLAARYDAGLAAETDYSRNRGLCLTNKLFSYMAAGLAPVLSATPAQRAFAQEAGLSDLLYEVDDAQALATLLDGLFGAPERLAAVRAKAWRLARERYNWERERDAVVERARRAISAGKGA